MVGRVGLEPTTSVGFHASLSRDCLHLLPTVLYQLSYPPMNLYYEICCISSSCSLNFARANFLTRILSTYEPYHRFAPCTRVKQSSDRATSSSAILIASSNSSLFIGSQCSRLDRKYQLVPLPGLEPGRIMHNVLNVAGLPFPHSGIKM